MRSLDRDTITQAVIARHAMAGDARLRELATSLVQHLHGFAREVSLGEREWRAALDYLSRSGHRELALLSDSLGLSSLVAALNTRRPSGATESPPGLAWDGAGELLHEPCVLQGSVRGLDGQPLAGAQVSIGEQRATTGADGRFVVRGRGVAAHPVVTDEVVAQLLERLGRSAWWPTHLAVRVDAHGHRTLDTRLFRRGDPRLDADPAFAARPSLVVDWVRCERGPAPDDRIEHEPFFVISFDFVLERNPDA